MVGTFDYTVDDDQVGFVHGGSHELGFLVHAPAQCFDLELASVPQFDFAEVGFGARMGRLAAEALELAQEEERFQQRHVFVQAPFLGQVADA